MLGRTRTSYLPVQMTSARASVSAHYSTSLGNLTASKMDENKMDRTYPARTSTRISFLQGFHQRMFGDPRIEITQNRQHSSLVRY